MVGLWDELSTDELLEIKGNCTLMLLTEGVLWPMLIIIYFT